MSASRRHLLFGSAALAGGAILAGCTSNDTSNNGDNGAQVKTGSSNDTPGKAVTIGFSAPAADHG